MKKWNVTACVAGSKYLGTFERETGEEAIEAALDQNGDVSLCHQCSSECEDGAAITATAEADDGAEARWSEEESWEEKARAAGWTPPKTKRAKKPGHD